MNKATIFFSHSSKDKAPIIAIKNLLSKKTGGCLDIFMSSDGQSVPFGSNWVHKVEEKLYDAKIMFVFVSVNSEKSGWTYFEAGYAYSKGIEVVPIGIGLDIETIKAPLGLLQGFNLLSSDSMNNIINIINRTFKFNFEESFTESDFNHVMNYVPQLANNFIAVEDIVKYEMYELKGNYTGVEDRKEYNIDGYYQKIVEFLSEKKIEYSVETLRNGRDITVLVARGITISYYHKREKDPESEIDKGEEAKITFLASPYSFEKCFSLLIELMKLSEGNHTIQIKMELRDNISCLTSKEDISAILSNYSEEFTLDRKRKESYIYNETGISFQLFTYKGSSQINPFQAVYFRFNCNNVDAFCIIKLLNRLCEINLIKWRTQDY